MPSETIVETVLAFLLAVIGGILGASLAHSHRRLCALISLGAGTLLGVTVFGILPESFEELRWWELLLALASGYGLFYLITKYVYHVCPACAASHFDDAMAHRFSEIATAMMIALAIHCTVDGLAIAAGQEAHEVPTEASRVVGISVVMAVCVHKVPEGLALGALLLGAGLSRRQIMLRVMAVEATTLLGGIAGKFILGTVSDFWVAAALAHAGGGFIYLAAHAILGEIIKHDKKLVLTNFAAGFGLIGALVLLLRLF
jgi:ZIP family zinc transporter/zinc and cadmium transporter